jgi:hypothetical protein
VSGARISFDPRRAERELAMCNASASASASASANASANAKVTLSVLDWIVFSVTMMNPPCDWNEFLRAQHVSVRFAVS